MRRDVRQNKEIQRAGEKTNEFMTSMKYQLTSCDSRLDLKLPCIMNPVCQ